MPGSPPSASTVSPESSANAGKPEAVAAAHALIRAFSLKVVPSSTGSGSPSSPADTASIPNGIRSSRISLSLPGLCVAITRRPATRRCAAPFELMIHDASDTRSHHRQFLQIDELHHALLRKREQIEELLLRERNLLGRSLYLHDAAGARHHKIGIGISLRILGVIEVEHRRAAADAAGDGGDMVAQRLRRHYVARLHPVDAVVQRDPSAGDGRRAGSAVGLDHVAVDRDLPLAQCGEIEYRAQAAPDQPLDLDGTPALLAGRRLAARSLRGGARQHAVFGRDPAPRLPFEPRRQSVFERGRYENVGVAELHEAGALGIFYHAALKRDRAQLVGLSAARSHLGSPAYRASF